VATSGNDPDPVHYAARLILIGQERVVYCRPLPVLPEQVVERFDSKGIKRGISFRRQQTKRPPALGVEPGQDGLERSGCTFPGLAGWLSWSAHRFPTCPATLAWEVNRKKVYMT
jgi:hypothetical protein